MSPASGEFFAPGRPDHEFGLETLGCESGRIRRQVRPTERCARRLVEKETADATGDRTDFERTVEHSADRELPVLPPMRASLRNAQRNTGFQPVRPAGLQPAVDQTMCANASSFPTGGTPVGRTGRRPMF